MSNKLFCITAVVAGMLISANVYALRPVWLLGHRCNSMKMIQYVLEDGGNGVEIDVSTGPTKGSHWSVAHDRHVPYAKCDDENWMRLEVLLNKKLVREDPRFCFLFIDVKDQGYIKELVEYVHKANKYKVPKYYILYGLNLKKIEDIPLDDIKYMADSLYSNEGFATQYQSDINSTISKLKAANYPITKFSYVDGLFVCAFANWNKLREAAVKKKEGQLCSRTGFWTCQYASQAQRSYQTNVLCDFNLTECRGWAATHAFRKALKKTYEKYICNPQKYGLRLATREDNYYQNYWH